MVQLDILTAGKISLDLPPNLPFDEWREIGAQLRRARARLAWLIGDWWAYGEHKDGDRKALVESEDWDGPQFQTCMNTAAICRAFSDTSRRRENLSFKHHAEVASLPEAEADRLLDWCEEPLQQTGRPRPIRGASRGMHAGSKKTIRMEVTYRPFFSPETVNYIRSLRSAPVTIIPRFVEVTQAQSPAALDESPGGGQVPPELAALKMEPATELDRVAVAQSAFQALTHEERIELLQEFASLAGYDLLPRLRRSRFSATSGFCLLPGKTPRRVWDDRNFMFEQPGLRFGPVYRLGSPRRNFARCARETAARSRPSRHRRYYIGNTPKPRRSSGAVLHQDFDALLAVIDHQHRAGAAFGHGG